MLNKLIEILISAVILIPFFGVLNKVRFHNIKQSVLYFVFAVYLSAVYLFVGMPTLQFMRFELSLTLRPFLPMMTDIKNTILNIFLFLPLGVMLPFLWKKYNRLADTLLFAFGMSLSIEVLQILTYRATDINDLIANTLGAIVGYFIFRITSRIIPSITKFARKKNDVYVIILSVFIAMFFIQPYLATLFYTVS